MNPTPILSCTRSLTRRQLLTTTRGLTQQHRNASSSSPTINPQALLSTPTWSLTTLLPPRHNPPSIPPSQLAHLLRLSALPVPSSPSATAAMAATLSSQLHFVNAIQQIDTTGIEPLRAIRDETPEGIAEATLDISTSPQLRAALKSETAWGQFRRPRRAKKVEVAEETRAAENWDVLGNATETVGGYFVVRSGKTEAGS
ncbi:DUF726 domain protein [Lasiosphaeria hispida]|uniref:DUF726 domain protein n=1 Tax=Lasiosphaeria hispida TaxID=260671 RepID=A0AAJ0H8L4_9PEZI|nr:DUF726 domain protein [Lasiosphaeria hispida]